MNAISIPFGTRLKEWTAKVPDEGSEVSKVRSTLQRSRHIYVIVLWYDVPFESALVASIFTATSYMHQYWQNFII